MWITRIILVFLYLMMLVGISVGLWRARVWSQVTYGNQAAQAEWQEWVDTATQQAAGDGPVRRRIPKSDEPPALILMRDHFAVCLGGALLLSSLVYATLSFFVLGVMAPVPQRDHQKPTG